MAFFPGIGLSYVETHYRFKAGFTLLSRRAPEILFDAPSRIDPGHPLPALLLIKDAHLFPVELLKITAAITLSAKHRIFFKEIIPEKSVVSEPLFHQLFTLPLPDDFTGTVRLLFKLDLKINGKTTFILNDNIPFASHADYVIHVAQNPLPTLPGYIYGETHFHSHLTCDQVEYGVPLQAVPHLASAMGLRFAFALDHSYDLDPRNPHHAQTDALCEWQKATQSDDRFILVRGEEVSVRNNRGKTVHLGVVNAPGFFPGYGDCGRSLRNLRCEHSIKEITESCATSPNALSFAAHPGFEESILERYLLNRGHWERDDYPDTLNLCQFWNGRIDKSFFKGRRDWINLLLTGKKIFCIGGTDAHGDFNRTRKIGFPFLTIREDTSHRFGEVRTLVQPETFSIPSILEALRKGRAVATNGPFAHLTAENGTQTCLTGDTLYTTQCEAVLTAISTPEFGPICRMILYKGIIGEKESIVAECSPLDLSTYRFEKRIPILAGTRTYLRMEVTTRLDKNIFLALTNPLYLEPKDLS